MTTKATPTGPYAVMDGAPIIGERGLLVSVAFCAADPRIGRTQGVIAHAQDAAGWWIGIGGDGRVAVGIGTRSGPVSLPVGAPLEKNEEVRVHARIPGAPGRRLEIRMLRRGREAEEAGVVIGSLLVPAPGSTLWGVRSLRDRRTPEQAFTGEVGRVSMIADADARPDDDAAEAFLGRWDAWVRVDASMFADQAPLRL